jgi:hypothetical protein
MNIPQCDREQEVVDALRSGRWASAWGEELRRHVAACPVCAEVAFVAQALRHEDAVAQADLLKSPAPLPSAGLVWWKAQLAARRAAEQRAAQPIALVERAAYGLGGLAAFGLAVWQWPRLVGWLNGAKPLWRLPHVAAMPAGALSGEPARRLAQALIQAWTSHAPALLLAVSAAAFLTFVAFAAYVVWREE